MTERTTEDTLSRLATRHWLGRVAYIPTWELQRSMASARFDGVQPDALLLLEHDPVFTLGRNSSESNILSSSSDIAARGGSVVRIERGGEVTFHGPGQLVAYTILKLEDEERSVAHLVDRLEDVLIDTLEDYGIHGEQLNPEHRGVWVNGKKIASIGLSVKRWISMHGIALNVDPDLSYFSMINPCGDASTVMTSMAAELGTSLSLPEVAENFSRHFARIFKRSYDDHRLDIGHSIQEQRVVKEIA